MTKDKEFDIVLWGATGAVGRRVAHHLAARSQFGSTLRIALGGRDRERLVKVRGNLGEAAKDLPLVVGDSFDKVFLAEMVARTHVVCSTVGPFALYGTALLEACVLSGTHYCDLTGEAHWMRKMIDAYQAEAEKTGARIVHACGHDSIPSDIGVLFLQKAAQETFGVPCQSVKLRIEKMKGGFSGGTAASFLHAVEAGPNDPSMGMAMRDPYHLCPEGQRQGPDPADKMMPVLVSYDQDLQVWVRPYFMAPMNSKVVRRTNALLDYPYGEDFRYEEARVDGAGLVGWLKAVTGAISSAVFLMAMSLGPTRLLLKTYVLPKSGEGPGKDIRETGFYDIVLVGKTPDGSEIRARVHGDGDPGVESTSRMLTEAALCLAEDAKVIPVHGGFWTPASAMGELLLARLTTYAGLSFQIEPH